jgi:hypothetical protein
MRIRSAFAGLSAVIAALLVAALAGAETTATMQDFNTSLDKDKNMRLEATAEITAPEDKVFDALSHPELTAKSDPQIRKVQVLSQDGDSKIVELFGQQVPMPNAPKSLKLKITTDKAHQTIKVDSYQSTLLQFQNEYQLAASKDGKGTVVKYTSTSNDISKQIGMDIPEGMRKQVGLETFMTQMHSVGAYIDERSKNVAQK